MVSSQSDYVNILYCGNKSQYYMISFKKNFFWKDFCVYFMLAITMRAGTQCNAVSAPAEGEVL